jgi:type IV secretion system protein VirB10
LIGGLWYADQRRSAKRMIDPKQEAFGFREARIPEAPQSVKPLAPIIPEEPKASPEADRHQARIDQANAYAAQLDRQARQQAAQVAAEKAEKAEQERLKKLADRRRSSLLIVSGGQSTQESPKETAAQGPPTAGDLFTAARMAQAAGNPASSNKQEDPKGAYAFMGDPTSVRGVSATYVGDLSYKLRQGKLIPAVLEPAITSEHQNIIRAVVQEDVYSDNGELILIPRGSKLVGEYSANVKRGQSRVFVIWRRLMLPNGVDAVIDSPGGDALGVAGMTGDKDTHFLERFGAAILLSAVDAYSQQKSGSVAIYGQDLNNAASTALQDSINIPPTIYVDQGQRVSVLLATDVDFRDVAGRGLVIQKVPL